MKLTSIIIFGMCAVALAEGMRLMRQTDSEEEQCCYPRPPASGRALRKQLKKCSDFPVSDIWENFQEDVEACKEKRKAERESAQAAEGVSTTAASPSADATTPEPDEKENETEFDADDASDHDHDQEGHDHDHDDDVESAAVPTELPQAEKSKKARNHHSGHKGNGKGKFHGGRGICIKEAMEKRGWAKDGQVNYEMMKASTTKAFNESASDWIAPVVESIDICSARASMAKPEGTTRNAKHHCGRNMTPEKQAWRCVVNNSILKSPTFLKENEYCQSLQTAHQKCLAQPSQGPMKFKWCGSPRGKNHQKKRPVQ